MNLEFWGIMACFPLGLAAIMATYPLLGWFYALP